MAELRSELNSLRKDQDELRKLVPGSASGGAAPGTSTAERNSALGSRTDTEPQSYRWDGNTQAPVYLGGTSLIREGNKATNSRAVQRPALEPRRDRPALMRER